MSIKVMELNGICKHLLSKEPLSNWGGLTLAGYQITIKPAHSPSQLDKGEEYNARLMG